MITNDILAAFVLYDIYDRRQARHQRSTWPIPESTPCAANIYTKSSPFFLLTASIIERGSIRS
jgi:hypothetical protein